MSSANAEEVSEPEAGSKETAKLAASGARDWWDKLGTMTTFITSVIIGGAGILATHLYNDNQLTLKREEIQGQLDLKKREIDGQLALKDREESRHSKVELTEALDKYAHYMFSTDPQQREFGYNLFTQLGFSEIALNLGGTTSDPAVRKVAESQVTSANPEIKRAAQRTLAKLTSGQRETIQQLLRRYEGTTYTSVYLDSAHLLVFGIAPWVFGSPEFDDILTQYVAKPDAAHAAELRPFLDRVKSHDPALPQDAAFQAVLRAAGGDAAMQHIQDAHFDTMLDITVLAAGEYGLQMPLSIAIIHDIRFTAGRQGVWGYADGATKALGGSPITGVAESAWIGKFLDLRITFLKEKFPQLPALRIRAEQYAALIAKGDWQLEAAADRSAAR